jgi:hydrogenase-4 component B
MQYTAGSFAGIITEWFSWILRPRRHAEPPQGAFPRSAQLEQHTPETVLEEVIEPASAMVMRVSTAVRRLQHGRLQSYVLYLVIGILGLTLLLWFGGG